MKSLIYTAFVMLFFVNLGAAEKSSKPNIMFIFADDQTFETIGAYGLTEVKTPNLDKMAKEGMILTDHYSGCTVCAPARCSLMTGLHTGHCFVRGNKEIGACFSKLEKLVDGNDLEKDESRLTLRINELLISIISFLKEEKRPMDESLIQPVRTVKAFL